MHGQVNRNSLVEALGQFEQPSRNRNSKRFGPELAAVLQLDCRGNCSPQVGTRSTDFSSCLGDVGHYDFNYVTPLESVHITKAGPASTTSLDGIRTTSFVISRFG